MEQFEQFCNEIIKKVIQPTVTVVSGIQIDPFWISSIEGIFLGDLVNNVGSGGLFQTAQYEEEWKIYRNILDRTNVTKYTKWLDIRGNHGKTKTPFPRSNLANIVEQMYLWRPIQIHRKTCTGNDLLHCNPVDQIYFCF